jgi:hypothetical protein
VEIVPAGAIPLGDLSGRLEVLRVACSKCDRKGQYHVARLIDLYGADMGLPDFKDAITGNCPLRAQPGTWDLCGPSNSGNSPCNSRSNERRQRGEIVPRRPWFSRSLKPWYRLQRCCVEPLGQRVP